MGIGNCDHISKSDNLEQVLQDKVQHFQNAHADRIKGTANELMDMMKSKIKQQ